MSAWKNAPGLLTVVALLAGGCGEMGGFDRRYDARRGRMTAAAVSDVRGPIVEHARVRRRRQPTAHGYDRSIRSGTLTAGCLERDSNRESYRQLAQRNIGQSPLSKIGRECSDPPIIVTVTDRDGCPLGNAGVTVQAGWLQRTLKLRTRTDGRAIIVPRWDGIDGGNTVTLKVTAPGGEQTVTTSIDPNVTEHTVMLQNVRAYLPGGLDLAFVVDCTGSMADELEFLKVEIRSIAADIARQFPQVQQRYALIAYRDSGDEYVTRVYDFTESLGGFHQQLGEQTAAGGGDYPEAVHRALEATGRLAWYRGNVARVVFHVADAPPHTKHTRRALKAVDRLRGQGVAVYPVAGSGVADTAEFTMRTEALLTGSSYLFLTDDSGVGNPHAEPHATSYNVEALKGLMIRMVASELSGGPLAPKRREIIRTVGQASLQ